MSKGNTLETDLLDLLLNGTAIADLADNDATSPLTSLYVSLHTADPGEAGDQSTSETAYTNYVRVAIARNPGAPAWTISSPAGVGTAKNAGAVTFAACGVTGAALTHFGVGTLSSGGGKLLYSGALTATFNVANAITPSFAANTLAITED
jgi:hypothetical protein